MPIETGQEIFQTGLKTSLNNVKDILEIRALKLAALKARRKISESSIQRSPDGEETFVLSSQSVRVQVWQGLHLKKAPGLIVTMLRVGFLTILSPKRINSS